VALETIAAELRRRNAWEATDLGVVMVRQWLGPIYAAWFAVALPLFVLLHLVCWGHWWLAPLLMWWLKPLLDRPLLYILSHALFGDPPDRHRFWRALPGLLLRRQALAALTWRRLDIARSFTLPVGQLEGLTGKPRRERLRDLSYPSRGAAIWLTVVGLHLEIALNFALIALVWMLIPDFVALEFFDLLDDSGPWEQLWLNVVGFCGLSLVEPFYVAAGFTLYLNRRAWLEAWDLEIGFRRMAARWTQVGRVAALWAVWVIGLGLLAAPEVGWTAAEPAHFLCEERRTREARLAQADSPVKQALAEALQEPELRVCQVQQRWGWREDKRVKPPERALRDPRLAQRFAAVIEMLLWFTLGLSIVVAVWWLWRRAPRTLARARHHVAQAGPGFVQGRDEMTVPPDARLGDAAWRLWIEGQPREALRMLYQGSLAGLATQRGLPVRTSATEDECLRLAAAQLADPELLCFLRRLTRAWQATAYAHRLPDEIDARDLCTEWSRHFATVGALPA